jgi:glucan phosphoethanolaminetransferase (alkaline phosphatase superfamily)
MISEKDLAFLRYWELNREHENNFLSKLSRGLPMALLFGLPIILLVVVVRIFLPDWYMKVSANSPGAFLTAVIAMVMVVLFYEYFRMQHKWEMNEQLYQEIKAKQNQSSN